MQVIVIGGGVVGAAAAYHLARRGAETLLVDRHDEGRATDAGAGIISPATSGSASSSVWYDAAVEAVRYYPELIERLRSDGVEETGYARTGVLKVAMDEGDRAAFGEALGRIRGRQDRVGYPDPDALREVDPERARELFPTLADPVAALHYSNAARVDGGTLEAALREAGVAHGLRTLDADAERLRIADGAIRGVETDDGAYDADAAVVAGGAWSSAFGEQLGVAIPVEPQRGQIAHLRVDAETGEWPIVSSFGHRYIVPWPEGHAAVGATDEAGVGFAPHSTVAGVHDLLGSALHIAPALADAALEGVRVGLRPVTADGLPVVGSVPGVDGAFVSTGHGPTGLQLGPYSGKAVADLLFDGSTTGTMDAFSPGRFD